MKKIIEGKLYDTKTAEFIGGWDNGLSNTDFGQCEETLHRTKKGQFFVAGSGGPHSVYSVAVGNNGCGGGSGLRLLSDTEAQEWAEEHLTVDAITEAGCFRVEEG